jgi:hypothetical protein
MGSFETAVFSWGILWQTMGLCFQLLFDGKLMAKLATNHGTLMDFGVRNFETKHC